MEIIIDIPANYKERLDRDLDNLDANSIGGREILYAVKDGIVLPKKHGALIDANELFFRLNEAQIEGTDTYMGLGTAKLTVENAPVLLEASKDGTMWGQEEKEPSQCENCIWYDRYNHYYTTPHNMPNVILNKCPHLTTLSDAKDMLSKVIKAVK